MKKRRRRKCLHVAGKRPQTAGFSLQTKSKLKSQSKSILRLTQIFADRKKNSFSPCLPVLLREKLPFGNRTFNGGSFFPFPARISAADPHQTAEKNKMILLLASKN
jgi:hypothetical protein